MTDERLLAEAMRGREAAFLALYERHRDAVFRFAYRMLGSVELAEDVTHDCFLGLLRRPAGFDPARGSLRTYLLSAARNLSLKHFRSTRGEDALDDLAEEPATPNGHGQLHRLLDQELSEAVRQAVEKLPPLQREAVVLFDFEELTLAEVAEVVGADVGTVKARLHRARQSLRKRLAPYLKGEAREALVDEVLK